MFLDRTVKSISIGMHCTVTAMRRQREQEQVTYLDRYYGVEILELHKYSLLKYII